MADHMRADLVCDALEMAIAQRQPAPGLIFHADRGSQYTSEQFRQLLGHHDIVQSLSRPRQCWDNAVAESWFATLKEELIYRQGWPTRATAQPSHLRIHRGVLQPPAPAQLAGESQSGRLRRKEEEALRKRPTLKRHNQPVRQSGSSPVPAILGDQRDCLHGAGVSSALSSDYSVRGVVVITLRCGPDRYSVPTQLAGISPVPMTQKLPLNWWAVQDLNL